MIRVYFDWNVISSLKKTEYQGIKNFIYKFKSVILYPYSPAHFNDLMKSFSPENEFFDKDLETLEYLSEKHLIRWEENDTKPFFATPKEYFEGEKEKEDIASLMDIEKVFNDINDSTNEFGLGNIGDTLKSLYKLQPLGMEINTENENILKKMFPNIKPNSSMWDLMKEIGPFAQKLLQDGSYYKDFRKTIKNQGLKLDPNHGNWSYDKVIKNIDDFLLSYDSSLTYLEYVKTVFKYRDKPMNSYEFYITAYLMLDMIGYKPDKLPKDSDNMLNIQTDAEHSFYGAHCDYFVALDKNLIIKTQVLYNEFNIPTKIIKPEDFISELSKVIHPTPNVDNLLKEELMFCNNDSLIGHYPVNNDNEAETYVYKLPIFYHNFFNYLVLRRYEKHKIIVLTFKKINKNLSRFLFYTEVENLIDSIVNLFGGSELIDLNKIKQDIIHGRQESTIEWEFNLGTICLSVDEDNSRPVLSFIISTKDLPSDN